MRPDRAPVTRVPAAGRNGFTLIELLVVIAIISLLISILLPSLSRARELARFVVCKNNFRSIGLGFVYYQEEHDGWLPAGGSNSPPVVPSWWETVAPYVGIERLIPDNERNPNIVFCCPTAHADGWTPWTYAHYAYNVILSPYYFLGAYPQWAAVGRPDRIEYPGQVVLFAEGNGVWYFSMGSNLPSICFDPRHSQGVGNVMFCDFHVEDMDMFATADLDPIQ